MEFLLVFLIFLAIFSAAELNVQGLEHRSDYGSFEQCLRKNYISTRSIVSRSKSEAYQDLNYQWQVNGGNIQPLAFILVENEADVVATVRCGKRFKIRLVPKGGGHSLAKFSFGDSNSVIVDVRNLKTVKYNKAEMTATVGAGMQIGPLAWKLWKLGQVFTPLGDCGTIGISGMATGGGYGYFVRKFGLTLDNVLELNIVTADGELLTLNENKNSDLFWALRGGVGSSFGIVTQFVFKVYPAPPAMFVGTLEYDLTQLPEVFKAWQEETPIAPNDIVPEMDMDSSVISLSFIDLTGGDTNFETIARKFPPNATRTTTIFTYEDFLLHNARNLSAEVLTPETMLKSAADLANLVRRSPDRIYQQRKSFFVNREIGAAGIRKFHELVKEMPSGVGMFFESYGGALAAVGRNETAFVHRSGTLYNAVANYRSQDVNDVQGHADATRYVQKFFDLGQSIFHHNESYQNYVDPTLPNYLERYYGSNLPRLVQIKKKYDPDNYFFNQQSVPTHL